MTIQKICLAGATGQVGRELAKAIYRAEDLSLRGAFARRHRGQALDRVIRAECDPVYIQEDLSEAMHACDILVDYTSAEVVLGHVTAAVQAGLHVVIGTSGLSDEEYNQIDMLARKQRVGVFAAGNFSLTATLLQEFAVKAAAHLPHWEIFDYGSAVKPDAPSGTSRELAFRLAQVRQPEYAVRADRIQGLVASRGASLNGSQVHSVRLPGYYSSAEVQFGLAGERLCLRHESISAQPYVAGTLLAIRKVDQQVGLRRGLALLLD